MIFSIKNPASIIYVFTTTIVMILISVAMFLKFENEKVIKRGEALTQKWIETRPTNISYKMTQGCMFTISYYVDEIEKETYFESVKNYPLKYQKRIDDLFKVIQKATVEAYSLDVKYNDMYGYPELISIDWKYEVYDDECFYMVENFKVN